MAWLVEDKLPFERPVALPASSRKVGNSKVEWFFGEPGIAVIQCEGGTIDDRYLAELITREELAACGIKQAQFTFDGTDEPTDDDPWYVASKTSHWDDIMAKSKRLIQSGQVQLLRNGANIIVAQVQGDHGDYQCEISRDDPNSRTITQWTCECPWDQYAFQRTRKWKKYEARPCAHVLAAYWKSLGTPLDEEYGGPQQPGQPPVSPPMGSPPSGAPIMGPPTGPPAGQPAMMPADQQQMIPGAMPSQGFDPNTMQMPQFPSNTPPFMAPPGGNQIIPPYPMDPALLQMPTSVPGGRPGPYPANPLQQQGTLSSALANDFKIIAPQMPERDPKYIIQDRLAAFHYFPKQQTILLAQPGYSHEDLREADLPFDKAYDDYSSGSINKDGTYFAPKHGTPELTQFLSNHFGTELKPWVDDMGEAWKEYMTTGKPVKLAGSEFVEGSAARINEATLGQSEGREGATDAGRWMEIPRNAIVEVHAQDQTTGWVEILYPLKGGPMTSYHVRCFIEPEKLTPLPGSPSPFQNPKGKK